MSQLSFVEANVRLERLRCLSFRRSSDNLIYDGGRHKSLIIRRSALAFRVRDSTGQGHASCLAAPSVALPIMSPPRAGASHRRPPRGPCRGSSRCVVCPRPRGDGVWPPRYYSLDANAAASSRCTPLRGVRGEQEKCLADDVF